MLSADARIGLVLSGGGARGAYEVGVVRYLAEVGVQPTAYAGASIGALNGAILAHAPSIQEGARCLEDLWRSIRQDQVLRLKPEFLAWSLIYATSRAVSIAYPQLGMAHQIFSQALRRFPEAMAYAGMIEASPIAVAMSDGLLDQGYLRDLLDGGLSTLGLERGSPLWVSVYPTQGVALDLLRIGLSELGLGDTSDSVHLRVQSLPPEERLTALMASAALPVAFDSQTIGGQRLRDGGMGGWRKSRGNTPIEPLIDHGCTMCIVVHLSDGSFWDRHDHPDVPVIEVRPQSDIHPEGGLQSLMNFNPDRLEAWMEQGYKDARRCVGNAVTALALPRYGRRTASDRDEAIAQLESDGLDDVLRQL
jgi:NTE family protein